MTEPATQHGRSRDDRADTQPGTPEGRRAVDLLWAPTQQPSIRGPKPRTSLAEVIAAGVAIADAEGLAALSIRKVASRLGIGAMSVYTYAPGRSELVELMIDHVYEEHALPDPALPWRRASRTVGPRNVAHLRHSIPGCSTTTWLGCRSARMFLMFRSLCTPHCTRPGSSELRTSRSPISFSGSCLAPRVP